LWETVLRLQTPLTDLAVPSDPANPDQLEYLAGQPFHLLNDQALLGTITAHTQGGAPNLLLNLAQADAAHLGYLFYFFEFSCALSAYLLQVNPYDQPGVEAYKKQLQTRLRQLPPVTSPS
jgi:glucose-6-phosphate isomerase